MLGDPSCTHTSRCVVARSDLNAFGSLDNCRSIKACVLHKFPDTAYLDVVERLYGSHREAGRMIDRSIGYSEHSALSADAATKAVSSKIGSFAPHSKPAHANSKTFRLVFASCMFTRCIGCDPYRVIKTEAPKFASSSRCSNGLSEAGREVR